MREAILLLSATIALVAPRALAQTCAAPQTAPYEGPLFDAMAQTGQDLNGEAAIAAARAVGVTHMALFARVHKREDGRDLVARLAKAHPDFVVMGAPKQFDMRGDLDSDYVRDAVGGVAQGRYAFIGEILYTHGDKEGGEVTATGERYIDPTRAQTARLVDGLKAHPVPILTHWEVYDWARDWPRFDRLYTAHPQQVFVWPHAGFGSPRQLGEVLSTHPNVWATLSKKEKAQTSLADEAKAENTGEPVADACGALRPEWRAAMMLYADRLMFATDAHMANRWANYQTIVRRWRRLLGQLPPDAAAAIAYGNAARLYGVAAS